MKDQSLVCVLLLGLIDHAISINFIVTLNYLQVCVWVVYLFISLGGVGFGLWGWVLVYMCHCRMNNFDN